MSEFWRVANDLSEDGIPFVVVTLVSGRGHVPQDPGAKAIVSADSLCNGTVGGGKVEARAIMHAREMLTSSRGPIELLTWNLTRDIGMTCGGEATYLFEVYQPRRWKIAVFGAGHVGQALVRTLERLDCRISCFDNRADWIEKLPMSKKVSRTMVADLPSAVAQLDAETFFVVMTQGHSSDVPVLEKIFKTFPSAPYVGVMGSEVKARKVRDDLVTRGIDLELVRRLRSPIGLPIGNNSPFEIAISVAAELLQVREKTNSSEPTKSL